ncbi:hypothetical protein VMCG_03021 [Cytospora schulzeri]|uniref:Uncharacterized protein n=1 Tax=Cytospora schulzeri TaxID=448051 RepID=A0A423WYB5_9PEZI|nr:hypothetical protein VMCG_03021 [Valsa malicola]
MDETSGADFNKLTMAQGEEVARRMIEAEYRQGIQVDDPRMTGLKTMGDNPELARRMMRTPQLDSHPRWEDQFDDLNGDEIDYLASQMLRGAVDDNDDDFGNDEIQEIVHDIVQDIIRENGGDEEEMLGLVRGRIEMAHHLLQATDGDLEVVRRIMERARQSWTHETSMDDLRGRLEGDWHDERERRCSVHGGKHYTHGIFRGRHPGEHLPEPITAAQVRAQARPRSERVWANAQHLQAIVERHEAALQRRWEKKSKVKRREMLQSAWASTDSPPLPPLPAEHRPGMRHMLHRCSGHVCRHDEHAPEQKRHLFMWPRLNMEDMCKTEPLLLLINARGRNSPAMFAFADLEPAHFGIVVGGIPSPPFLDKHSMVFTGRNNPGTYGELVSWEDDPEAYRRLHNGRDTSPGEGLWILEIQDRLYKFLVAMCKLVLHDIPLDNNDELLARPVEPVPTVPTANNINKNGTAATSLLTTRLEAQYHVPAKLNMRRLQTLVAAKLSETEDTLWAMREDPGVFATSLLEKYESQPEHLLDSLGKRHPMLATAKGRRELMAQVVRAQFSYYVPAVEIWGFVHDKVARLAELKERLFDNAGVLPGDDLPPKLAMAFYSLLFHLQRLVQIPLGGMCQRARLSPPLQHLSRITSHEPYKLLGVDADYIYLVKLMSDPQWRANMGLHNCVEEIECIASDPVGRKLISPTLARDFSDIAILSECLRQIELFQPWASTFEAAMADRETANQVYDEFERTADTMNPLSYFKLSASTSKLGAELAWMKYPVDKRPNKANVDAMRAAEDTLDAFWVAALAELKSKGLITRRIKKVLVDGPKPERTPAWVEPPKKTRKKGPEDHNTVHPFGGIPMGAKQPSSTERQPPGPKSKVKSRGVARPPLTEIENLRISESPPRPEQPRFPVDRRAFKVFDMLFYRPFGGAASQPGEIPWVEFTHAMHQVGFGVEKLGGSAWQFTPGRALEGEEYVRGIQFHEPHPVAKIPFRMARLYGRRLARAYGWCADMFQLKAE